MKASISGLLMLTLASAGLAGENWPQWRGPGLDGSSDSKGLPVSWSETQNVRWKTRLPSWSAATPAVWGDRIFVMSPAAAGGGPEAPTQKGGSGRRDPEGKDLLLLCLSRKSGEVLWQRKLDEGNTRYNKQNMSSPSPVTDGRYVWALTGPGVAACLDLEGKPIWRREIQKEYGKFALGYGYASSPLLFEGKLVIQVLHGGEGSKSYLLALHADTGENVWKVDRPTDAMDESPDAYTSPTLMRYPDRTEIIVAGGDYFTGHDPKTGREVWRCGGLNPERDLRYRQVCSPVVAGEMVFSSARRGPLAAAKGGGQGNVTATHLAWTGEAAPDVPTPASDGKYLYVLNDAGMMSCLDPQTGKAHYLKQRLPAGSYSASPLVADGKVYVTSENARTTVLAAGAEFKVLGENRLEDDNVLSSIAVAGRELFIRTAKYLYCIGEAGQPASK